MKKDINSKLKMNAIVKVVLPTLNYFPDDLVLEKESSNYLQMLRVLTNISKVDTNKYLIYS